tara:strand:+ start:379 stop:750 length:372 start_codon:yes stop_codon:yes gene_type:complete
LHWVAFPSLHVLVHTPQERGHIFNMYAALSAHCFPCAQFEQSLCRSRHVSVQTPHERGQTRMVKADAGPSHLPLFAHSSQAGILSAHLTWHAPQVSEHSLSMNAALEAHSPISDHVVQWECLS